MTHLHIKHRPPVQVVEKQHGLYEQSQEEQRVVDVLRQRHPVEPEHFAHGDHAEEEVHDDVLPVAVVDEPAASEPGDDFAWIYSWSNQ